MYIHYLKEKNDFVELKYLTVKLMTFSTVFENSNINFLNIAKTRLTKLFSSALSSN